MHATLDSQLMKYFAQKAPAGRLSGYTHTHTYKHITWYRESNSNNKSKYKINKQIRVQNAFSTFPKAWNQSFDWILSGFVPLPTIECMIWLAIQWIWLFPNQSKHFCARPGSHRPRGTRAQKCFDRLGNDQIHWISNQMMHSIVGKGENPLSIWAKEWF